MDLCKVPDVKFLWNKNLSVFFYFHLQSLFPFFSGVFVNGHLYVIMKKEKKKDTTKSSTDRWTARKPCWSCVCLEENQRDSAMTIF